MKSGSASSSVLRTAPAKYATHLARLYGGLCNQAQTSRHRHSYAPVAEEGGGPSNGDLFSRLLTLKAIDVATTHFLWSITNDDYQNLRQKILIFFDNIKLVDSKHFEIPSKGGCDVLVEETDALITEDVREISEKLTKTRHK